MKKFLVTLLLVSCMIVGCKNNQADNEEIIGGANEPATIELESNHAKESESNSELITDEEALNSIKNYCYENYPDVKEYEESGECEVGWNIESSDEKQIVVAFRSYTAAIVRFYIDSATGETYITEYVDGITPEEEPTGETFNIQDYSKIGE